MWKADHSPNEQFFCHKKTHIKTTMLAKRSKAQGCPACPSAADVLWTVTGLPTKWFIHQLLMGAALVFGAHTEFVLIWTYFVQMVIITFEADIFYWETKKLDTSSVADCELLTFQKCEKNCSSQFRSLIKNVLHPDLFLVLITLAIMVS